MTRTVNVKTTEQPEHFSLLIVAVGYESRSRNVAEKLASSSSSRIAFTFGSTGVGSYDANLLVAQRLGFLTIELENSITDQLHRSIASHISRAPAGPVAIGIDISSFTKFHIAEIVDVVQYVPSTDATFTFLYSPASSRNWKGVVGPIQIAEPIHPAFASWTDDPIWPLTAIVGLGVDENLALGVAEYLDVSAVYAFRTEGADAGFDAMSADANAEFFLADYVTRVASYKLNEPRELFTRLESLIYGLRPESRIAIVPLGPKIFVLCALLATLASDRATTVWRFSGGSRDEASNVTAAGPVVSLSVQFGNS